VGASGAVLVVALVAWRVAAGRNATPAGQTLTPTPEPPVATPATPPTPDPSALPSPAPVVETTPSAPTGSGTTSLSQEAVPERLPGEKYPQTRLRELSQSEIDAMGYSTVRYAINEMFARYGFTFSERLRPIRAHFETMSWYHPAPTLTLDQIEGKMTAIEHSNFVRLGKRRNALVAAGQAER
jgi:hypothetical protein